MIKVVYYRKHNRVTIKGHAYSDVPGHDLVCAGVSTLAYTLAANANNMASLGYVRIEKMRLDSGHVEIHCSVKSSKSLVARIFEAVCVGFEMLASEYPQYINYEIHG